MAKTALGYFKTVDILRGFAAMSVVVYHVIEHWNWKDFPASGIWLWFRMGWMGVDLFFVISGFVIGLSAFSGIDKLGAQGFRLPFIRRRLVRIVPLHYLTIGVFLVFIVPELLFEGLYRNLFAHLFFVHNLSVDLHGAINGPNWSLGTEMQFYCLMLLIAPWVRSARWWQIVLVFVGIAWAWRFGTTRLIPLDDKQGPGPLFIASTQLPGMLDEFAAGLLLARFVICERGQRVLAFLNTRWGMLSILLAAGLAVHGMLSLYWPFASYWNLPWMVTSFRSLIAFAFAMVVLAACAITPVGIFRKLLAPFLYLGTISYGIYLWHLPVLFSLKRIAWLTPNQVLPLGVGLTLMFAAISWHFFEQPLIERYSGRGRQNPA